MKSLGRIFAISFKGLKMTFMSLFFKENSAKNSKKQTKGKPAAKAKSGAAAARAAHLVLLLLLPLTLLSSAFSRTAIAQPGSMGNDARQAIAKAPPPPAGQFRDVFSLADISMVPAPVSAREKTSRN